MSLSPPGYSLQEVLAVARIHPFYSDAKYPPDKDTVEDIRKKLKRQLTPPELSSFPLLWKADLYIIIERLAKDKSPENTYRKNVYTSVTGGGTSSQFMFFATDALENREHRKTFGRFLQNTGVIKYGDWALSTHWAGDLYRSLDLILETMENAGASILAAGCAMAPERVISLLQDFHINVLTGDASQILSIVHHISTLASTESDKIKLDKIIYTSELLTAAQKKHIRSVLGPIKICSVLGSSEAGPYGVGNPDLTDSDPTADYGDFIFDTRMTLFEILPLSCAEDSLGSECLPEGQKGMIAQTSLSRLRNPLVRYMTGDIGSLHSLPTKAQAHIPESDWPYTRVLRLYGRDHRFSFKWDGAYWDFDVIRKVAQDESFGIMQWQVILDRMESSQEASLEIRLLCCSSQGGNEWETSVVDRFRELFTVFERNEYRFQVVFVDRLDGFELSQTGRKVVKFIDRFS